MKRLRAEEGFTLIELLVVLVIIGILSAIALVRYQDLTLEAQIGATKGNLATIRGGISLLHAKFLLAGYGGTSLEYPTVAELNNNITFGRTAPLNGLKIIDGPSNMGSTPPCVQCMPPDSVLSNRRLVVPVTTTQADTRYVSGGAGSAWDYDPSSGQIYVASTSPIDSLGYTANLW